MFGMTLHDEVAAPADPPGLDGAAVAAVAPAPDGGFRRPLDAGVPA